MATMEVSRSLFETIYIILVHCRLELCVIMHRNKELMQMKQPLQVFSSSTSNNSKLNHY